MVEIKTERASYYISTHGKCEYIDIEPGTDTFTFLSPESLKDIVHQVFQVFECVHGQCSAVFRYFGTFVHFFCSLLFVLLMLQI